MRDNQTISVSALSRVTGLDRGTIATRLQGIDPVGTGPKNCKLYDRELALEAVNRVSNELAPLKARKLQLEIARIEEANAVVSGELVRCDTVKDFFASALSTIYRSSLSRLPRQIADQAMRLSNSPSDEDIVAATTIVLTAFWSDLREGRIFPTNTSLTPTMQKGK